MKNAHNGFDDIAQRIAALHINLKTHRLKFEHEIGQSPEPTPEDLELIEKRNILYFCSTFD